MAAPKDPYKTLGVDKKASAKEIQQAYAVLSDPEKRKQYDQGGGFFGGGFDPGAFRTGGGTGGGGFGGVGDILSDLFGGGGGAARKPGPGRGRDLETEVHISFEQAMEGAQVPVAAQVPSSCPTCHGTGAKPGTSPTVCPRCQGRGIESQGQGLFSISQPCPQCGGTGTQIKDPCPTCQGRGQTLQVKRYRVNIPAGVRDGSRVRLAGTKRTRVPAGTQHGTVQRLRGEGPPKLDGKGRGDIHYRLLIDVPRSLNREQEKAVDELAQVMNGNPRERLFTGRA